MSPSGITGHNELVNRSLNVMKNIVLKLSDIFTNHVNVLVSEIIQPISSEQSYIVSFFLQHPEEYKKILSAVKGAPGEKRLASQFIPRFFKHFPSLAEQAIDAQLDLCEDDNTAVSVL